MNIKKLLYIIGGCIGFGIGAIGSVVPVLPTFPFLLLAAFCFAKSSERLHNWFLNTKLYKNNLESYVQERSMTKLTKMRIMATVTLLMGFGFLMMSRGTLGRIIISLVWVFHIVYFMFGVKTLEEEKA